MASGHVNRTKRPNTWLHRPTCMREESPCQPGAVHTWHKAAVSPPTDFKSANGTIADVRENDRHMARTNLIFGDIDGKLTAPRLECTRCSRKGRYKNSTGARPA